MWRSWGQVQGANLSHCSQDWMCEREKASQSFQSWLSSLQAVLAGSPDIMGPRKANPSYLTDSLIPEAACCFMLPALGQLITQQAPSLPTGHLCYLALMGDHRGCPGSSGQGPSCGRWPGALSPRFPGGFGSTSEHLQGEITPGGGQAELTSSGWFVCKHRCLSAPGAGSGSAGKSGQVPTARWNLHTQLAGAPEPWGRGRPLSRRPEVSGPPRWDPGGSEARAPSPLCSQPSPGGNEPAAVALTPLGHEERREQEPVTWGCVHGREGPGHTSPEMPAPHGSSVPSAQRPLSREWDRL